MPTKKNQSNKAHRQPSDTSLTKYRLMIDEWFINEFNGAKAYRKFHPKASQQTAEVKFSQIKAIPAVAEYIEQVKRETAERNKITIDECVELLSNMARFDITDMYNEDGTLKNLKDMPKAARLSIEGIEVDELFVAGNNVGLTKKIKLSSRRANIVELMKHLGGYEKDNAQKTNITVFTPEQREARIQELLNLARQQEK